MFLILCRNNISKHFLWYRSKNKPIHISTDVLIPSVHHYSSKGVTDFDAFNNLFLGCCSFTPRCTIFVFLFLNAIKVKIKAAINFVNRWLNGELLIKHLIKWGGGGDTPKWKTNLFLFALIQLAILVNNHSLTMFGFNFQTFY